MAYIDFFSKLHNSTKRDYIKRVVENDKAKCAAIAKKYGKDYWDGDRACGYGGYHYDGRWLPLAKQIASHFGIKPGDRILDIGCGKGYLLYEFTQAVEGVEVVGVDISTYALENSKPEIKGNLQFASADKLPFDDDCFDVVVSLGALHNLPISQIFEGVKEIERVGRGHKKIIMLESWRSERERANLLYWQLTCESFHDVENWEWIYKQCNYSGDWGFIFFE